MSHLHNMRSPMLHGDFKPSDVLIPAKTLQPKITNFGLWDFKNYFIDNAQPEFDHLASLNPCQAPEVLVGGERPTLFSDIWALCATLLQWLLEIPPWDFQELCSRYKYRDNKQVNKFWPPRQISATSHDSFHLLGFGTERSYETRWRTFSGSVFVWRRKSAIGIYGCCIWLPGLKWNIFEPDHF